MLNHNGLGVFYLKENVWISVTSWGTKGEGDTCPTSEGYHAPSVSRTFFRVNIQAQSCRHGRSAPDVLLAFIIPSAKTGSFDLQTYFPHGQNARKLLKSTETWLTNT